VTSKTADLDQTITLVNKMLSECDDRKDKLAIMDRLIRLFGLKYRYSDQGKGGKFSPLPEDLPTTQSGHSENGSG
jgi:hypothetical protein